MTAPEHPSAGTGRGAPATVWTPRRTPRPRRWLRLALPIGIVALFWLSTAAVHVYEEPNLAAAGTLAPDGTGRHGSSQLAELLRTKGVTVERVASTSAAAKAAATGPVTIFIPAPDYLTPGFLPALRRAIGAHRIVLVRPGLRTLLRGGLPAGVRGTRWATATVAPECRIGYAQRAGVAAVRRDVYTGDTPNACYGGSVISFVDDTSSRDAEVVFVGATEPFRNDRLHEYGNAALATGLLGEDPRVIWVDVHRAEALAQTNGAPGLPELPEYSRGDRNRSNTGNPVIDALPATFWAVMVLVLSAALLLAVARARRLGAPVREPLPVLVPAAEAVTGRGRLYERIKAREASFEALRASAISRLARVLDHSSDPAPERELARPGSAVDRFVAMIAARANVPEATVRDVLYGRPPSDDDELLRAVERLDQLVVAVVWDTPDATQVAAEGETKPDLRGGRP